LDLIKSYDSCSRKVPLPESSKTGPTRLPLLSFASNLVLPSLSNGMSLCALALPITQDAQYELWQGAHCNLTLLGHCIGTLLEVMESCAVGLLVVMVSNAAKMGARKVRRLWQLHDVPRHHLSYNI